MDTLKIARRVSRSLDNRIVMYLWGTRQRPSQFIWPMGTGFSQNYNKTFFYFTNSVNPALNSIIVTYFSSRIRDQIRDLKQQRQVASDHRHIIDVPETITKEVLCSRGWNFYFVSVLFQWDECYWLTPKIITVEHCLETFFLGCIICCGLSN